MTLKLSVLAMTVVAFGSACASAGTDDIALSLVHKQDRIDIPRSAIRQITARASIKFRNTETKKI